MNTEPEDKIVYVLIDGGADGKDTPSIAYASFDRVEFDKYYDNMQFPNSYRKDKQIVEINTAKKEALVKLDGIQRLVLGLPSHELPNKTQTPRK